MSKEIKTPAPAAPTLLSDVNAAAREAIYDKANPPAEPPAPAVKPDAPAKPGVSDFVPPAPVVDKDGKPVPTPVVADPDKKDDTPAKPTAAPDSREKKDERTVPLEALHESREENKLLKKELAEHREQIKVLLADVRELSKKPEAQPEDPPLITDYDQELNKLRTEVKELRERDQTREKLTEAEQRRLQQQKLQTDIKQTHAALETEGFKGFEMCLPMVVTELQRLAASDPDAAKKLDNPDGWKKIFKETIFPKVMEVAQKQSHTEKVDEKTKLKDGASLLLPAAPAPAAAAPEEDDYTFDKYMKDRSKRSPQPQRARS